MTIKYLLRYLLLAVIITISADNYTFSQPWLEYRPPFDIELGPDLSEPYEAVDCVLVNLENNSNFEICSITPYLSRMSDTLYIARHTGRNHVYAVYSKKYSQGRNGH